MIVRAPEFKYLITKYLQPFIVPTPWQLHPILLRGLLFLK